MDYIFNFLMQDYQQVALYMAAFYAVVFVTVKINTFYLKTKEVNNKANLPIARKISYALWY